MKIALNRSLMPMASSSPGFIDAHCHTDWNILEVHGTTTGTAVPPLRFAGYADCLYPHEHFEEAEARGLGTATRSPARPIRELSWVRKPTPTTAETESMKALIRKMDEGALGLRRDSSTPRKVRKG